MEGIAKEFKRILADNGSLFVYSHARRVAYVQIIYDKYFTLENNMVWRKPDSIQYQYYSIELSRSFNTHNERILFYSNGYDETGNEIVFENFVKPQNPFSKYLQEEFAKAGVTRKEIAQLFPSKTGGLTGCVSNWLNGDNFITEEQYLKIREYLNNEYLRKEYEELRKEYEELRKEYEELRRPFNNIMKLEDVLTFSQESSVSKFFDHETIKPLKLSKALVATCSRERDLVYIPFVGSGSECVAVNELNRIYLGSEINPKYVDIAEARIRGSRRQNYDIFYDAEAV